MSSLSVTDFIGNISQLVCSRHNKDILRKLDISFVVSKGVFTLKDKYNLSVSELLSDKNNLNILFSFLACDIIKKKYPETDLQSLIILILGENSIKYPSLIKFCLALLQLRYDGSEFLRFLLISLGFSSKAINLESEKIVHKYIS